MIRVGPDLVFLSGCRMSGACQIRPDMPDIRPDIRQNEKSGRMIWLDIRQNEKSGRIIRHCRISGPTLLFMIM